MIYRHLMNGNEKFGIKKIDLCHSRLGCEPNDIGKNVILAPWWEPDMFRDSVEDIYLLSELRYKIWVIKIGNKKITYIKTGIGAPVITDAVLALSCTPCENIVFIGAIGGLTSDFRIGDFIIPEYSVCGNGACRFLTEGNITENDCFGKKYRNYTFIYTFLIANKTI